MSQHLSTTNWWETIFSGSLKIGINEHKMVMLENESFLYLNCPPSTQLQFNLEIDTEEETLPY